MAIGNWYMNDNDESYSSYTDFTAVNENRPAKRKASAKRNSAKKKRTAGKALLCVVGALTISAVSIAGTWIYLTGNSDTEDLMTGVALKTDSNFIIGDFVTGFEAEDESYEDKDLSAKSNKKSSSRSFGSGTGPAYDIAEEILDSFYCDDDFNTAWEIFNWVHSNITYQTMTEELSFEDAAYRGFTRRSGDCYVYFACAKVLLDCAGIPNMMVERYPVITNGHYWNLVQIDGEWYHCDATVFRDHPDMYFMLTDEEIADEHHEFDGSLYPERASYCGDYYYGDYDFQPGEDINYIYDGYDEYYYDDYSDSYSDDYYMPYEDYSDCYIDDEYYVTEWGWN